MILEGEMVVNHNVDSVVNYTENYEVFIMQGHESLCRELF